MEPIDRSNSPPIISIAAPIARMPSWAAGVMKFMIPDRVNMELSAVTMKNTVTTTRPAMAPSSGRFISRAPKLSRLRRSSATTWGVSDIVSPPSGQGFAVAAGPACRVEDASGRRFRRMRAAVRTDRRAWRGVRAGTLDGGSAGKVGKRSEDPFPHRGCGFTAVPAS